MILVLTEAGSVVGHGHLSRCLALTQNLPNDFKLLVHPDPGFFLEDVTLWPWRNDISGVASYIKNLGVDALLIDSYLADISMYQSFKDLVKYVLVFDDYDRIIYPVDLIVNPSVMGPQYLMQVSQVISGSDWVVLRREIIEHQKKRKHSDLKHIVLSFGGADKAGLLEQLLPVLLGQALTISVVCSNDITAKKIKASFVDSKLCVYHFLAAKFFADLLVSADLVISAGGQTLNELAYLGVPFLAIESGPDQFWNISAYVNHNVTPEHFTAADPDLEKKLLDTLMLLKNPLLRSAMAERGIEVIDGGGAARIAEMISLNSMSGMSE